LKNELSIEKSSKILSLRIQHALKMYFESISKAKTTTAKWTRKKYKPNANIDFLIIVVFSPKYKLEELFKIPLCELPKQDFINLFS